MFYLFASSLNSVFETSQIFKHYYLHTNSRNLKIKICKTKILPWSLTLREERRLRVFENRVLRKIFGPKRDEVTWEWRKLPKEKLNDLFSPPNVVRVKKSRRMR